MVFLKLKAFYFLVMHVLNRDPNNPQECNLIEGEDHVEVNGEIFQKPFVEKPVSAEEPQCLHLLPNICWGWKPEAFSKDWQQKQCLFP